MEVKWNISLLYHVSMYCKKIYLWLDRLSCRCWSGIYHVKANVNFTIKFIDSFSTDEEYKLILSLIEY